MRNPIDPKTVSNKMGILQFRVPEGVYSSQEDADMKRIDQNLIIRLGSSLKTLHAVDSEADAFDIYMVLESLI